MVLSFLKTNRNNDMLEYHGFLFMFKRRHANQNIVWQCRERQTKNCTCIAVTTPDGQIQIYGEHSHAGDLAKVEAMRVVEEMLADVKATRLTSRSNQILAQRLQEMSEAARLSLPLLESLKRRMRRIARQQKDRDAVQMPPQIKLEPVDPVHQVYSVAAVPGTAPPPAGEGVSLTTDFDMGLEMNTYPGFGVLPQESKVNHPQAMAASLIPPGMYLVGAQEQPRVQATATAAKRIKLEPGLNPVGGMQYAGAQSLGDMENIGCVGVQAVTGNYGNTDVKRMTHRVSAEVEVLGDMQPAAQQVVNGSNQLELAGMQAVAEMGFGDVEPESDVVCANNKAMDKMHCATTNALSESDFGDVEAVDDMMCASLQAMRVKVE